GTDAGNSKPRSVDTSALSAGSYNFQGAIAGDSKNVRATSRCEPLTVNKAQLTISTDIHDASHNIITSAALGAVVHDTATVGGQVGSFTPTGAITFTFDSTLACGTTSIATDGTDAGNSKPRSVDTAPLSATSYNFRGAIAGDS